MDIPVQTKCETDPESERNCDDSDTETPGNLGVSNSPTNSTKPMEVEPEFQVMKRRKRTKKSKAKSLQISKSDSDSTNTETPPPIQKPFFKAPILKDSQIYLWNAGGKRRQLPTDVMIKHRQ